MTERFFSIVSPSSVFLLLPLYFWHITFFVNYHLFILTQPSKSSAASLFLTCGQRCTHTGQHKQLLIWGWMRVQTWAHRIFKVCCQVWFVSEGGNILTALSLSLCRCYSPSLNPTASSRCLWGCSRYLILLIHHFIIMVLLNQPSHYFTFLEKGWWEMLGSSVTWLSLCIFFPIKCPSAAQCFHICLNILVWLSEGRIGSCIFHLGPYEEFCPELSRMSFHSQVWAAGWVILCISLASHLISFVAWVWSARSDHGSLSQVIPGRSPYGTWDPGRCLRCAVVGNSGNLRGAGYGATIDKHNYVMR